MPLECAGDEFLNDLSLFDNMKIINSQHKHFVVVLSAVIIFTLQIQATQQDIFYLDYSCY